MTWPAWTVWPERTAIDDMCDDMVVLPSPCRTATWLPAQSPELPANSTVPALTARIGVPYAARKSRPVWYRDQIPYCMKCAPITAPGTGEVPPPPLGMLRTSGLEDLVEGLAAGVVVSGPEPRSA